MTECSLNVSAKLSIRYDKDMFRKLLRDLGEMITPEGQILSRQCKVLIIGVGMGDKTI